LLREKSWIKGRLGERAALYKLKYKGGQNAKSLTTQSEFAKFALVQSSDALKGQCQESSFFFHESSPQALENNIREILNFFLIHRHIHK
jgi:hypothetical protein